MNTTILTQPAKARTDVVVEAGRSVSREPQTRPTISQATVRRLGLGLTAGALTWAATIFTVGTVAEGMDARIGDLGGLAFQLGLFGLLTVQFRTLATGLSRTAVAMLKVEYVLLTLASIWSVLHATVPADMQDAPWLVALDMFWPLSMLGMFVIGVKIAFAGRWTGLVRWWPLVAETWAVVTVPSYGILGQTAGQYVGGVHLLIGYGVLGLLLTRRPHETGASA
jgi:hypothetical protein